MAKCRATKPVVSVAKTRKRKSVSTKECSVSTKKRPAPDSCNVGASKHQSAGAQVALARSMASSSNTSPLFYHRGVRYALSKANVDVLMKKIRAWQ